MVKYLTNPINKTLIKYFFAQTCIFVKYFILLFQFMNTLVFILYYHITTSDCQRQWGYIITSLFQVMEHIWIYYHNCWYCIIMAIFQVLQMMGLYFYISILCYPSDWAVLSYQFFFNYHRLCNNHINILGYYRRWSYYWSGCWCVLPNRKSWKVNNNYPKSW